MTTMDFVALQPYEISCHIFQFVPFTDRIVCLGVSRTWQTFLRQWPWMWRDLDFMYKYPPIGSIRHYLKQADPRTIQRLSLYKTPYDKTKQVLSALVRHKCHSITSISFFECDVPTHALRGLLKCLGNQLRELSLDKPGLDVYKVTQLAFSYCPNLLRLSYNELQNTCDDQTIDTHRFVLPPTLSPLKTLKLVTAGVCPPLDAILAHCPNLQTLVLDPMDYMNDDHVLLLVQYYCRRLESFYFQPHLQPVSHDLTTLQHIPNQNRGLRELVLDEYAEITEASLFPLLGQHHNTIEVVRLHQSPEMTVSTWSTLAALGAPRLREFSLDGDAELCPLELCFLIGQFSQSLEIIHLESVEATDGVAQTLASVRSLRELSLCSCPRVTENGLIDLICDTQSPLEKLNLVDMDAVTDNVLGAIATHLKHLRQLDISRCRYVTDDGVRQLVNTAKRLERVRMFHCHSLQNRHSWTLLSN